MPYSMYYHFNDETTTVTEVESLIEGVLTAKRMIQGGCDELSRIDIVSNDTGEVVYAISANVTISIDIEEYNPYSL